MKHEAWSRDLAAIGVELRTDQLEALAAYVEALERVAVPRGMVAPSDAGRLWDRHVLDSLRAVPELLAKGSGADIGSGAGLPGIPLAVALPEARWALIERRRNRAAFLEAVVDDVALGNVEVIVGRAADVADRFDACVARAFSSPSKTWEAAQPLLRSGGVLVYWAGERFNRAPLDEMGISVRLSTRADLARTGPLVIMGRQ